MHAQKRMVGMMAQVAISNKKVAASNLEVAISNETLTRRLFWLTWVIGIFTAILILLAGAQLVLTCLSRPESAIKTITEARYQQDHKGVKPPHEPSRPNR